MRSSNSLSSRAPMALVAGGVAILGLAAALSCSGAQPPTAVKDQSAAGSEAEQQVVTLGTIALPINQSVSTAGVAFGITQTGTGLTGTFTNNNAASAASVLSGLSGGGGVAVRGLSTGQGNAGFFQINNTSNGHTGVIVQTNGAGNALSATTTGAGSAGLFQVSNSSSIANALYVLGNGPGNSFNATATGNGRAAFISQQNSASGHEALNVKNYGSGWSAIIQGVNASSKGLMISTIGGAALQVVGGSKNAVVGTSSGARALYTEESAEVWFTDYGFAQLHEGVATVPLDATFSETVSADEPYHVFVQPYGKAELYVAQRTPGGFQVALTSGDSSVEFSYRIVARRKGFERARLERAPWADKLPAIVRH